MSDEGEASDEEVAAAFAALTPAELAKLNGIAKLRACYAPNLDWRDLLHDAIDRTLSGKRKWPRSVPLLHFLREVMRSLASEARRRAGQAFVTPEADLPVRTDGENEFSLAASQQGDAESQLASRQLLGQVLNLFKGDPEALALIEGLADGLTPAQVQARGCLTPKAYATAQKRVRRAIARAFPEGRPS